MITQPALLTNNETAQLATDAVVDFKKCNFSNMKTVCDWSTGDNGAQNLLSAVVIDDCLFANMQMSSNYYGSKAITITNSTLYKMTERVIYVKDANSVVITVENCTLADMAKTPFESDMRMVISIIRIIFRPASLQVTLT